MGGGTGALDTAIPPEPITVPSGVNLRVVNAPGIVPNRILRGGGPTFTTAATVQDLMADWDLRTVLDLRSESEVERDGAAEEFLRAGVEVRNVPLTGYPSEPINASRPGPEDFVPYYQGMLTTPCWTNIFHHLAEVADRPFLMMCACGKDRTGVVTALILGALGVPDRVIAADYALTRHLLLRDLDLFADKWLRRGHTRDDWVVRTATQEWTILEFLGQLRGQHGDICSALVHHGVRSEDLDRLADRLVTR